MIIVCRPVTEIEHLDVLEYVNSSLYRFGGQADARAAGLAMWRKLVCGVLWVPGFRVHVTTYGLKSTVIEGRRAKMPPDLTRAKRRAANNEAET